MKKTYRVRYRIVDGFAPDDRDKNYLCFSIIRPHVDGVKTLVLDEDIFNKILKRCRTIEQHAKIKTLVSIAAQHAIEAGKNAGSFFISV